MRLMIVDDHPVIVEAVSGYLERQNHQIVAKATSVNEAMSCIDRTDIDVAVMDIMLGEESAYDILRLLKGKRVLPVVAFTGYDSPECVSEFLNTGGIGFVSKSCKMSKLTEAVEYAEKGLMFVAPDSLQYKLTNVTHSSPLSDREQEVVRLITAGYSSKMAAEMLFVSMSTIKTHKLRIFRKLGVHTIVELTRYAIKNGLTTYLDTDQQPGGQRIHYST